jgi:hypothetical protein
MVPALPDFPANREFYREFSKIITSGPPETANKASVTGLPTQIPCSTKQEIISADQAILAREQGIFPQKINLSTDQVFTADKALLWQIITR